MKDEGETKRSIYPVYILTHFDKVKTKDGKKYELLSQQYLVKIPTEF